MSDIDPEFRPQQLAVSAFVAPNATLRGNVVIGEQASIWFGAVVRGDTELVQVGARTNVQDLAVLHADPGFPCRLGADVTIGHAAVVHGATVEDGALIGIRAVVLNGAVVGTGTIVGAGAVVTEGMVIPPRKLVVGVPARVVRDLGEEDIDRNRHAASHYVEAARVYLASQTESPKIQ